MFLRVLQNLFGRLGFLDTAFQSGVLFDERLPFRLQPPQLRGFGAYHLRIDADDRQHDDNQRGKRRHHHFSETAEAVALLPYSDVYRRNGHFRDRRTARSLHGCRKEVGGGDVGRFGRRKIIIFTADRPVQRFGRKQRRIHLGVYVFGRTGRSFRRGCGGIGSRPFGTLGRERGSRSAGSGIRRPLRFGNALRKLGCLGVSQLFVALLDARVM